MGQMKRNLIICDDEKEILNGLSAKIEELQSGKWSVQTIDTLNGLEKYLENEVPDVILLDIQLGDGNGIDMACEVQKKYPYLPIIFITGFNEYAQEVFRIRPIYVLTKPFEDKKICDALNRAEEYMEKCKSKHIKFTAKGNIYNIDCKNICYAESAKRKLKIVTTDEIYEVYMKMNELVEVLPDNFICSHKSYIVNMNYIQKISNTEIALSTGNEVPVSRTRYKDVKEKFMSYATN